MEDDNKSWLQTIAKETNHTRIKPTNYTFIQYS